MLRPDREKRREEAGVRPADVLIDRLLVLVALVGLARGYSVLIDGTSWWSTVSLVVATVLLGSAVVRALRVPGAAAVAPLVGTVLGLVLLTWVFVPQTLAGVFPTSASAEGLWTLFDRAGVVIVEEKAPVGAGAPIVLLLTAAFGLLALNADVLLGLRRAVLPLGVLLVGVFVAPAVVVGETPSFGVFLLPAAAWIVLLWRHASPDGPRRWSTDASVPAVIVGASALIVAAALPPALPDITAVAKPWGSPPPEVFGRGINPMLQLGQNLRRNSDKVALTYTTDLPDAPYLSVSVLRDFTGKTWKPARERSTDRYEGDYGTGNFDVERTTTRIRIDELKTTMLPVPYPAVEVEGLKGQWNAQRVGALYSSRSSDTRNQTYTVTSLDKQPTAEQMHAITTDVGPSLEPYVDLPDDLPRSIAQAAQDVAGDAPDEYAQALALQSYFQDGSFVYSEEAPVEENYDGNSMDVIAKFLKAKSGYCVHYSSAMAVMARSLGIPARIVVGYAPGEVVSRDGGESVYKVTTDDLHAWPQLYFAGVGWVGFEPTPSVGAETDFSDPGDTAAEEAPEATPTPTPTPTPSDQQTEESTTEATATSTDAPPPWRAAVGVLVGALVLVAGPGLLRAGLRRRRLRRSGSVEEWWREVLATARDAGLDLPGTRTVREHAAQLQERVPQAGDAIGRLVSAVETSRYARPGEQLAATAEDARTVVDALLESASIGARAWPRSFVTR